MDSFNGMSYLKNIGYDSVDHFSVLRLNLP